MPADSLTMPKLGLTMQEGLLAEWKVAPGDRFRAGDLLYVVETDKISNEIEADEDGEISEILVAAGQTVPVGTPVARLAGGKLAAGPRPSVAQVAAEDVSRTPRREQLSPAIQVRIVATPLARRTAREHGIDLVHVRGTGPRGRIKSADVLAATVSPKPDRAPVERMTTVPLGRRIPISATHATIARRLSTAKRDIPHFYIAMEADIGTLTLLRQRIEATGLWKKTTVTAWIVAAIGRALAEMPEFDRVWNGDDMLALEGTDVGVAVDSERGLYVPVIRNAGRLSVGDIAGQLATLSEKVRDGRLSTADTGGGAITLSNLGMHGVSHLTPIINPGQAMILGVGAARPVFRPDQDGRPALRNELNLVLAADHRVLNGVTGARFLKRIVALVEAPFQLVLQPPQSSNQDNKSQV